MKTSVVYSSMLLMGTFALLLSAVVAAPVDNDEENALVAHPGDSNDVDYAGSWDAVNAAALRKLLLQLDADDSDVDYAGSLDAVNAVALRKLLLQLDADDRFGRVSRSWPAAEPRGWGVRALDGRLARPWRADKRQVRFRQCYFNPISCFRK